jgi:hypothetical protein
MAVAGINLNINFEGLRELQANIKAFFPKKEASEVLGDAIEKAIYPAFLRLGEVTPRGPTLNLRRAVAMKVKKYPRDGGAVGLIGYRRAGAAKSESAQGGEVRAGPDRAFHQWWLEFGTQQRVVSKKSVKPYTRKAHLRRMPSGTTVEVQQHVVQKGQGKYIASSFNRLGPFKMVRDLDRNRVQTDPAYPKAFFKASANPIVIPPTPEGGRAGVPPVQTAWDQTQGTVAQYLQKELSMRLSEAWAALRFKASGSITGTDTL